MRTVTSARFRNPPAEWKGSSGLVGATFALVLIFIITIVVTGMGSLTGAQDAQPGDAKIYLIGWSIAGIILVALVAYVGWATAPPAPDTVVARDVNRVALAAAITTTLLRFALYLSTSAENDASQAANLVWLVVFLLLIAGPLVAWLAALLTRSSGRSVVVVSAATAFLTLATTLILALID
jgi:hypothetical protein